MLFPSSPLPRALKQFSHLSRPLKRKHFQQEAHILASLSHPFVVPLEAVFEDESEGAYYLQMPLLPSNLSEWLRSYAGPLAPPAVTAERLRDMIYRVAIALQYVHSRNIIHRDLKPSNVLLDAEANPLLSDFDHSFDPSLAPGTFATHTYGRSVVMGSGDYMAPETKHHKPATAATDVWAAGKIFAEMCNVWCLRHPEAAGALEGLRGVARRMLAKNPEDRPDALAVISTVRAHMR